MTVELDHTIVPATDPAATARFLTRLLGLSAPMELGWYTVVEVGATRLLLERTEGPIGSRHYAFLVDDDRFDQAVETLEQAETAWWADPSRSDRRRVNRFDGGRGLYVDDPDGHLLELITVPVGSTGTSSAEPHPLVLWRPAGE